MIHEKKIEQQSICDASGFKYPASELVKQWDGAMVHYTLVDRRNPQDFVTGIKERVPAWSRPEAGDVFISTEVTQDDL